MGNTFTKEDEPQQVYGENSVRQKFRTVKYPYDENSVQRKIRTAKIPKAKNPYGKKSVQRRLLTAKNPTAKIPTAKYLTAKNPSARTLLSLRNSQVTTTEQCNVFGISKVQRNNSIAPLVQ